MVDVKPAATVLNALTNIVVGLSGLVIALMAVHIVCDVAARYLFASPIPGTVEIVSRYYMIVLVFLPLIYVQKRDAHFVAGLFTDKLPARPKQILIGVTQLTMAAVSGLMGWTAVLAAIHATRTDEQVTAAQFFIYTWPGRWLVPTGLGLMSAYALMKSVQLFRARSISVEAS